MGEITSALCVGPRSISASLFTFCGVIDNTPEILYLSGILGSLIDVPVSHGCYIAHLHMVVTDGSSTVNLTHRVDLMTLPLD